MFPIHVLHGRASRKQNHEFFPSFCTGEPHAWASLMLVQASLAHQLELDEESKKPLTRQVLAAVEGAEEDTGLFEERAAGCSAVLCSAAFSGFSFASLCPVLLGWALLCFLVRFVFFFLSFFAGFFLGDFLLPFLPYIASSKRSRRDS